MTFFKKLSPTSSISDGTTRNFFIGTPEAEGESTANSRIKLGEIFGDFLNVFSELEGEKFIISGRKGSGKSAIAEYILFKAHSEPNVFCEFIKSRDFHIQKIVQIGKAEGLPFEEKLLFEWIILTKLIGLLIQDQSLENRKEINELKKFLEKNSGFIDIKEYEIEEVVRNKGYQVNIEYFKRAFNLLFKRDMGIKEHKAPFYKLLVPLQETVIKLLKETVGNENEYFLIFDDLDIGFQESNRQSIDQIVNILRVCKDYNIDFFGKNGLSPKIIVLLRDDIKRIVLRHNADTAKIFSSYEIPLIWYEHENFKNNENGVALKQLINKRIGKNFDDNNIYCDHSNPWNSLIKSDGFNGGSSFKHVIDYTFFRPRDLILFFKSLPQQAFDIPLSFNDITKLCRQYVGELVAEVQNELTAIFSPDDIGKIFTTLKILATGQPFSKQAFFSEFEKVKLSYDFETTLIHLFDYCIIGNFNNIDGKVYFKHRGPADSPQNINFDLKFILHQAFVLYFKNK